MSMQTIPATIQATIHQDVSRGVNCWFYTIDAYLPDEPDEPIFIDYGSVESQERALACVAWALTHRDQCDYPEYVQVNEQGDVMCTLVLKES